MENTEKEIISLLNQANNKYFKLHSTHPKDKTDWVNVFSQLQDILTRRILRRDYPTEFNTVLELEEHSNIDF